MSADNVYSVHDEDGRITQSNKVFDDEQGAYGRLLAEREWTFLQHGGRSHADIAGQYVWHGELCNRPVMRIAVDKASIKAGGVDVARVRGVPRGAQVTVYHDRYELGSGIKDAAPVDIAAQTPGRLRVLVRKWPYQDWIGEVEAVP